MTDSQIMEKWHKEHIESTLRYFSHRNLKVLVIGCGRGEECKIFSDYGVTDIVGVDVLDDIGENFVSPSVKYVRGSAEDMQFFDNETFDLVYSYATFEHISDIENAYQEAWRVLKSGGVIHIYSSPLWNSPYGNHYENLFHDFPWIHLYSNTDEVEKICIKHKLPFTRDQIEYMLISDAFNRRSSFDYKYVCSQFNDAVVFNNTVCLFNPSELNRLDAKIFRELKRHYCTDDLLGSWHLFEARKLLKSTMKNVLDVSITIIRNNLWQLKARLLKFWD